MLDLFKGLSAGPCKDLLRLHRSGMWINRLMGLVCSRPSKKAIRMYRGLSNIRDVEFKGAGRGPR